MTACGERRVEPTAPSPAPPKFSGVKIGKPYCIAGKWYRPAEDPTYDRMGIASWYGPGFNGRKTANGEIFNQYDMTAAHPTLPMPCFVKVTNMENGRMATVRVNDRGPFHSDRIIDLSKAAAEKLGITGTARVRVQHLQEATRAYIASNGNVYPDELRPPASGFTKGVMPREKMTLTAQQDADYYQVNERYLPAPLEVADNSGSVVDSAPVISVQSNEGLPDLVKPAMAEEAPYPTARELELKTETTPAQLPTAQEPWVAKIASFSERMNAEKLMQQIAGLGQPELQPVIIDGKEWFRVYLHPKNGQSAEELLANLQKIGLRDAQIVQ